MKFLTKKIIVLFFTLAFSFLAGCQHSGMYSQTEANVADATIKVKEARKQSDDLAKPTPALVVKDGLYVDKTPISLAREPMWLKNKIILKGDQLPFSYYSRTVANGGGRNILTRYQSGLDASIPIAINYSGTVKGALDLIAAKSGYVYVVNGNDVYWQAFITKTFDIAFMPGSSDYMMGKGSGSTGGMQAIGGTGGSSAGGSGMSSVSAMVDDSASSQYSNLKGTNLSVWKDLEDSIKQMLSPDGKVMVSQATTSVTVRDKPSNVALISKFISNLNNNLSKQVLIKIQVLDVLLSNAYDYGINWNAVKRALGTNFVLQANYGTPVSITPFVTTTPGSPLAAGSPGLPIYGAQTAVGNGAGASGVTALINALTQQGKVSVVTEPRVVCLNNQVSVVRILNQQGYIANVQTTNFGSSTGGSTPVTTQVTPGTLITGFTLYVLPKIMGEKVYLQVNADLSSALSIDTLSSTTGTTPSATSTVPVIQTPRLTQKQFNQRSVIASGATLIISGFRQVSNTANAMQLFNQQELGGKGAIQQNLETIVLITPIILNGPA